MKVVVDAFGGDYAPLEIVKGAALAQKELGVEMVLTGRKDELEELIQKEKISFENLRIVDAPDVITMHDEPTSLLKAHRNSSMAVAFDVLNRGEADAFVSAGSTGAIVVGGTLLVKRLKGVKRPALAGMLPSPNHPYMLMDMGANADCRPEMLAQFGVLASIYLEKVAGIENPSIRLLNIGTEDTKGGELQKQAYELLSKQPINFTGNVESRDMPKGVCDAVIADGFTGNIALKLLEGATGTLMKMIKVILKKNVKTMLAAAMLKKDLYALKEVSDSSQIGGAILLGVRRPVIKAHGNSNAQAIKNAIRQAKKYYESNAIEKMCETLSRSAEENE